MLLVSLTLCLASAVYNLPVRSTSALILNTRLARYLSPWFPLYPFPSTHYSTTATNTSKNGALVPLCNRSLHIASRQQRGCTAPGRGPTQLNPSFILFLLSLTTTLPTLLDIATFCHTLQDLRGDVLPKRAHEFSISFRAAQYTSAQAHRRLPPTERERFGCHVFCVTLFTPRPANPSTLCALVHEPRI